MARIGDWTKVRGVIGNLAKEMQAARDISLKQFAIRAESNAKRHMSLQDLEWKPLEPETVASKIRKRQSELILIATSTYFQSITSWTDKATAYAGVKRNVTNEDGEEVANIAAVHEFGSKAASIPARPLWQPTFEETYEWWKKNVNPVDIFTKRIEKYKV